jgi:hypothetical protein
MTDIEKEQEIAALMEHFGWPYTETRQRMRYCIRTGQDIWTKKHRHNKPRPSTLALDHFVIGNVRGYFMIVNGKWIKSTLTAAEQYACHK